MSTKDRISNEVKQALKAGDKTRVGCLRMLKSKILEREVALRPKKGADYQLQDEETLQVLSTYAKQRREAIDSYREAGREELARQEEIELAIIREYLPQQLSEEQIREIVAQAVKQSGASSPAAMGEVMKRVVVRTRGAADGKLVSRIVREALAKK
jgi:uncharacterized protein YqeY